MNLIAIDTSTDWCGVSFFFEDECKSTIEKLVPRKHSELLPEYISQVIKEEKIDKKVLDAVAVSVGPGSFTGLRIGVGFAKGFAYANSLPIVPISTLEIIANDPKINYENFSVNLFSHRDIVFHQEFKNKIPTSDAKAISWNQIKSNNNLVHYGCEKLIEEERALSVHPAAKVAGELAIKNFDQWVVFEPYTLTSNYISPFQVENK